MKKKLFLTILYESKLDQKRVHQPCIAIFLMLHAFNRRKTPNFRKIFLPISGLFGQNFAYFASIAHTCCICFSGVQSVFKTFPYTFYMRYVPKFLNILLKMEKNGKIQVYFDPRNFCQKFLHQKKIFFSVFSNILISQKKGLLGMILSSELNIMN